MGWFSDLFDDFSLFGDVEAAEDDLYSIPEDDPFYIDFDTPDMIGDGSVYQGDDMGFDINDYIDLSTGIATDDPFHIDFSNIPDMLGDGSVYEGDDMDFSIFDLLDIPDKIGDGSVYDYDDPSELDWDSDNPLGLDEGPLGGQFGPWLRNLFIGSGSGPLGGGVTGGGEGSTGGILGALLGLGGGGGGIFGGGGKEGGGGLGSLLGGGSPLLTFLAMKSLMKDEPEGVVPIGEQAYGQAEPFNYQDYQPTNLTPALMPGVGYANMGPPSPPPPPKVPGMQSGGTVRPGDITFAKLEPGEFVIQKPAVDAVGIETLEQINNMGNGGSYYG